MTDHHVHIGQYRDRYFFPEAVVEELKKSDVSEAWISSTTSCIFCKEFHSELSGQPSAKKIEDGVTQEFQAAIRAGCELGVIIHPLYWVVPEFEKSGVKFEDYFSRPLSESFFYEGFKIHPRAQNWNFISDEETASLARRVFSFADSHSLTILIHTGVDEVDSPKKFEPFIKSAPNAKIILAHLKNIEDCLYMMKNYPNLFCDTALAPKKNIDKAKNAGFSERILYGSDFPICSQL